MKTFWLTLLSALISLPLFGQISVPQLTNAVTIDGTIGAGEWSDASVVNAFNNTPVSGVSGGTSDISGNFQLKWDPSNLYLLYQITDDARQIDSSNNDPGNLNSFEDDSIELYFDVNNSNAGSLTLIDQNYQYRFGLENNELETGPLDAPQSGISFVHTDIGTSYQMEISIPWSTLGFTATLGNSLGFDAALNDDDDGGARDAQLFWNAINESAFNDASQWGDIQLTAAIPEPSTVTLLMGLASIGVWLVVRKRRNNQAVTTS